MVSGNVGGGSCLSPRWRQWGEGTLPHPHTPAPTGLAGHCSGRGLWQGAHMPGAPSTRQAQSRGEHRGGGAGPALLSNCSTPTPLDTHGSCCPPSTAEPSGGGEPGPPSLLQARPLPALACGRPQLAPGLPRGLQAAAGLPLQCSVLPPARCQPRAPLPHAKPQRPQPGHHHGRGRLRYHGA